MVEFLFIFKHSKRFHCIAELLGVVVVYFSWGREANGRSNAVVFLRLLPTRHGADEHESTDPNTRQKQILHTTTYQIILIRVQHSTGRTWTITRLVNKKTLISSRQDLQLACSTIAANTTLCKHSRDSSQLRLHHSQKKALKIVGRWVDQERDNFRKCASVQPQLEACEH